MHDVMKLGFSFICFPVSYFIYILCFVVKCLTPYPVNLWSYWIYCYYKILTLNLATDLKRSILKYVATKSAGQILWEAARYFVSQIQQF